MTLIEERKSAIHLLRAGQSVKAAATALGRSSRWVRKWRKRYQTEGWEVRVDYHRMGSNDRVVSDSAIVQEAIR